MQPQANNVGPRNSHDSSNCFPSYHIVSNSSTNSCKTCRCSIALQDFRRCVATAVITMWSLLPKRPGTPQWSTCYTLTSRDHDSVCFVFDPRPTFFVSAISLEKHTFSFTSPGTTWCFPSARSHVKNSHRLQHSAVHTAGVEDLAGKSSCGSGGHPGWAPGRKMSAIKAIWSSERLWSIAIPFYIYIIDAIFRGTNIHLPTIWMFTKGKRIWPRPQVYAGQSRMDGPQLNHPPHLNSLIRRHGD
jgi:hypothetical protein